MNRLSLIHRASALVATIVTALALPQAAGAAMPSGFHDEQLVRGLTRPVNAAWAPDGRIFIAEKDGRLKVVPAGGGVPQLVLDFSEDVTTYEDRGFLGLAVDSSFALNGYVFISYTAEAHPATPDAGPDPVTGLRPTYARVERLKINAANAVTERTRILGKYNAPGGVCPIDNELDCIPSDSSTHSIGTVISAPDGTLYVGAGDGAEYGEPDPKALRTYDENSLSGKILHVDRDGDGLPGHPFCPGQTDAAALENLNCTKVHAAGFRNPFRFTLRPDGALAVGDVGWNSWEELDLVSSPGTRWGWPCYEGAHRTPGYDAYDACATEYAKEGTAAAHRLPTYEYPHNSNGRGAIIAGPTYTGSTYPAEYQGAIFVADYTSGWIRRIHIAGGGSVTSHLFDDSWVGLHLGAAPNGDLVYISVGNFGGGQGSIRRVSYDPGKPTARATAESSSDPAPPLAVQFDGSASSDPEGQALTYHWDFGEPPNQGEDTQVSPVHTYANPGSYWATLTVDDLEGKRSTTDAIRIEVGNAPVPTIAGPPTFRAGQQITLEGLAIDADTDESVPEEDLSWSVVLVHGDHSHSVFTQSGSSASFVATTDHDADSHYEATLTATDGKGLSADKTLRIDPETAQVSLASSPPGAPLSYAGRSLIAPTLFPSTIGFETSVSAASSFARDGGEYVFRAWSDGGARLHSLTVPAGGLSLSASYDRVGADPGPPGGSGSAGDADPPLLRFDPATGFGKRKGILTGRVTDGSGVRRVDLALARLTGSRCRWWSLAADRPSRKPSSCQRPRWMRARLNRLRSGGYNWRLALGAPPARGTYILRLRAFDTPGNVATRAAGRRTAIRLTVRP